MGSAEKSNPHKMSDQAKLTNHTEIKSWAEKHKMKPAQVADAEGLLRLMKPSSAKSDSDGLEEISWNDWFEKFDDSKLALLCQSDSDFNKLVSRG